MKSCLHHYLFALLVVTTLGPLAAWSQQLRLDLKPVMLTNEAEVGDPAGLVDEQRDIIGPPVGKPSHAWEVNSRFWNEFPFSAYLDLGTTKNLSSLWLFDTNGSGDVVISAGEPGKWQEVETYDCGSYLKWVEVKLDVTTRYLRITRITPGANFSEIAVYEYSDEAFQQRVALKAEKARREAERQAALQQAREEALKRPLIEMAPYGMLSLVDEIDCSAAGVRESPTGVSKVETILGRPARVLPPTASEAAYFTYRIGKMKLLRPSGVYVLAVDYPEDAPRSMLVINTGNETSRGFHTGETLGDALHPKYVNNLVESIDVPLTGEWQTWSLLFRLHDRFPETGLLRGAEPRPLTPENGFDVTIAQFSAENTPISQGAAVGRIRLFEVVDPHKLTQTVTLPPEDLPRRHLFWREEMADGIIDFKTPEAGLANPLDWYRYKAELMLFLGMRTYSKDLLEFGACQHWDTEPHGGNDWMFHDSTSKHLWAEVVELMGSYGFEILPYYEYSGSKGYKGLGNQRRARPLTRDDAYTHISWVESANADLTDPDTIDDFQKMLDLTVLRLRSRANFAGIWIRSRGQMPISFSDKALSRFSKEAADDRPVTRETLKVDADLYGKYLEWWGRKRRDFLIAMRDYLQSNGVPEASVLFTGSPSEPGVSFNTWDPLMVTDQPDLWQPILQQPQHAAGDRGAITPLTIQQVVDGNLYLQALTTPGLNWGDWEVHHSRPADDPQQYQDVRDVMLTHAFNRNYTVASPQTMQAYRTPSGLAMVRHYTLNENMMFDKKDEDKIGYFVVDIERAGPYCMMAEALAVANGDPTMIGYLVGCNFGRGFPQYVRNFNANYLALPALPSQVLEHAASDREVVVRSIVTEKHGIWIAVVNTSLHGKQGVSIALPSGQATDAVTGAPVPVSAGKATLDMYPCQLRTFRVRSVKGIR
ncbi:hypothetical protein [Novipirellula artificiosorum]|uniref:Uncharacterized protein n=1 Tax=Novipirellula artificiosorum TaxID=2528016 RepID=A0A5C6CW96_9BACT|nr:hypothetical protein [Novipirellula artificiosorum]TWU28830.1 hypothetical protein Poly41_68690 [Novipirellula artificiosorum]